MPDPSAYPTSRFLLRAPWDGDRTGMIESVGTDLTSGIRGPS